MLHSCTGAHKTWSLIPNSRDLRCALSSFLPEFPLYWNDESVCLHTHTHWHTAPSAAKSFFGPSQAGKAASVGWFLLSLQCGPSVTHLHILQNLSTTQGATNRWSESVYGIQRRRNPFQQIASSINLVSHLQPIPMLLLIISVTVV